MSTAVTQGIRVTVRPRYLEEHSDPAAHRFVFAYAIVIANEGDVPVQLMSRHWIITDGDGKVEHVEGDGVVGRQPVIAPGEAHEYASFCPLTTPVGAMQGTYRMVRPDGSAFDATIAPFSLAVPSMLN